jgi:lysozyme
MAVALRKNSKTRSRTRPRRQRGAGWGLRLFGFVMLLGLLAFGWVWWEGQHWRPDEAVWPDQGALVSQSDGLVDFGTVKGLGADFVYLAASSGADKHDARFADNFAAARAADIELGVVHRFDPCVLADRQSANFVTMVPRDDNLLPPAIHLAETGEVCPTRVSRAAIQSELMTLVNQIEAHAGKPVILSVSRKFEERYRIAGRIERNLWVSQNWFEPSYAGRPWILWTANNSLRTQAADEPIAWVVIRP